MQTDGLQRHAIDSIGDEILAKRGHQIAELERRKDVSKSVPLERVVDQVVIIDCRDLLVQVRAA